MAANESYEVNGTRVFPRAVPAPAGAVARPAPRLPCYGLAELSFGPGPGKSRRLGILSDVSEGGAFVLLDHGPLVGARVELGILEPGGVAFRCRARVVRASAEGVALSFEAPSEELPRLLGATRG
ncbi:MAG: PilZ domain-containing protein [Myxococcales bacterium]